MSNNENTEEKVYVLMLHVSVNIGEAVDLWMTDALDGKSLEMLACPFRVVVNEQGSCPACLFKMYVFWK